MSDFQSLFQHHLERRGLTIYRLSKELQIDRSTLYQVHSGARLPTVQIFQRMAAYFELSSQEEREWLEAWKQTRLSPKHYRLRRQVERCIQTLEQCARSAPLQFSARPQDLNEETAEASLFLEGRSRVFHLLQAVLESQLSAHEKGPVDIHLPSSFFSEPIRESSGLLSLCGSPQVRQLFSLSPLGGGPEEDAAPMLAILNEILDRFFSNGGGRGYIPYFYYRPGGDAAYASDLFPYYVIAGGRVLLLSADLERCLLLTDPQAAEAYRQQFDLTLGRASPLFRCYDSPVQAMRDISPAGEAPPQSSVHFFRQPCLVMYTDRQIVSHALYPDCPDRERLVDFVVDRYGNGRIFGLDYYNFFTLQGTASFLADGVMQEFPGNLVRPLPREDRLTLVRRLRDFARLQGGNVHCINPELISVPEGVLIDLCFGRQLIFSKSRPEALNYLVVSEPGLVRSFLDYFRALPSTPGVYSREESAGVLDKLLEQYS